MKYLIFFLIPFVLEAQPVSRIIFSKSYEALPLEIRIENSGVYGLSSFEISGDTIKLIKQDIPETLHFVENELSRTEKNKRGSGQIYKNPADKFQSEEKSYVVSLKNDNLILTGTEVDEKVLFLGGNLAYAEVIGCDKNNNLFLYAEFFVSQVPLKTAQKIFVLNAGREVINILEIPDIKYLSTINDFILDSEGNLFHLLSDVDHLEIIKWTNLESPVNHPITYPKKYNRSVHFNNFVKTDEVKVEAVSNYDRKLSTVNRMDAVRIGEKYVYHQFYCDENNLAPNTVTASDGDEVKTPNRFSAGINARVGYKWGGFNTIEQYDSGLENGKFAADIHTAGVSAQAVGVDCSGFVSRCWQLNYHSATSMMPNITTEYSSWDQLKPGDAIHKFGHVRLFINRNPDGSFLVVEASARDWGVSYWSYKPSDLTNYTPRRLKSMENIYSGARPKIISTISHDEGTIIKWNCDTTDLYGFRIYRSFDAESFELIAAEDELKSELSFIDSTNKQGAAYYKISSVKLIGTDKGESLYSSIYGVNRSMVNDSSTNKILIVDGFSRRSGSWRGEENNLSRRYLSSAIKLQANADMVASNDLSNTNIQNYDFVYWIAGDESTVDETFDSAEQQVIKEYLETGGRLLVSGSEIGWDLDEKGSAADKEFYRNYLKAVFINDNANSQFVQGTSGSPFADYNFRFGQNYEEDYPDVIAPYDGSSEFVRYGNGKTAGITYSGKFGESDVDGALVYIAFPLETIAGDGTENDDFLKILDDVYFHLTKVFPLNINETNLFSGFNLKQNYPNPFNPSTKIEFTISSGGFVSLDIFNVVGEKVSTLISEEKPQGEYQIVFDSKNNLSSGVYYYRLSVNARNQNFTDVRKMILLK